MIIEEIDNKKKEKERKLEEVKTLKKILDLEMPNKYYIKFFDDEVELREKGLFGGLTMASIYLENEIIVISFLDGFDKEVEELREYFEKSKNKFKIKINEFYFGY